MKAFLLKPAYKDYLWGGTGLKERFGKQTPLFPLAESWECSVHLDGPSVVYETGETLAEFIKNHPESLGTHASKIANGQFPILVKLIDANQNLSIQVHPYDEYAAIHENGSLGKTEMWFVIDAQPGASLIYGFNQDVSKKQIREAVENGTIEKLLNHVPVKKGDVFLIEPGTIHSIGKGCVIAEIQESSNLTYRLYDYNRNRELHIKKALDVITLKSSAEPRQPMRVVKHKVGYASEILGRCKYFQVERIITNTQQGRPVSIEASENTFHVLLCIEGKAVLRDRNAKLSLNKGDCCFIPAGNATFELSGKSQLIYVGC